MKKTYGGDGPPGPPDGGYGWVVVTSAFFIMGLTTAVLKNFGIFFLDIQSHFGVQTSTTSWVTSTTIAMFHLAAPVASALTLHLSQRAVVMIGGFLAASGMILVSLELGLFWLYITMGLLQGAGISLSWIPANSMVSHYFGRRRPLAVALSSCGECVFSVLFAPFFQWLVDAYGWQGALLIVGGLQLNLCVCGALLRPLDVPPLSENKGDGHMTFQCSLLMKPELVLYILFAVFAAAGFFIPPIFLVPFTNRAGLEDYWPASILSILALADLMGRLVCGWVATLRLLRNLQLLTLVVTLVGVVLLLLPLSHNYWSIAAFAALYGFLFGCVVAIHVTALVDIVKLEGFDSGLGLWMLFRSIGGFMGPPAAGWLVDQSHDYSAAFYLSGLCLIASAVFVVLVDLLLQRRRAAEREDGDE
ncbi:hypothetical protein JOB18_026903 [Solea senegalensis]|uniref:Monocarboxylate transporter 13-like n=1 Tax=Solea senegalensis TaxID=28829 RepID=A0AAV6QIX4_SOLSE|nr:monocarboxylate transporter 13 [Solea senegalensis]KAG7490058.1 monocarboxylate transporter 13-like [Solea senegalensis]KAG7490059.1 hypothetical protein JOB18_026903 [Solea senegalensis]KAG7490060.1 hypothetical protein JOB18_026903 [Solea senegalensis]